MKDGVRHLEEAEAQLSALAEEAGNKFGWLRPNFAETAALYCAVTALAHATVAGVQVQARIAEALERIADRVETESRSTATRETRFVGRGGQ